MAVLPKPKTFEATVGLNLNRVQAQIAEGLDKIEQVQVLTSSFIKDHFERIPPDQVRVPFNVICCSHRHDAVDIPCPYSSPTRFEKPSPSLISMETT
jgi:hypothetical protein